jgi:hypothetical protein
MGVHVDRLDPLSANHHREFLPRRLLAVRAFEETATAEDDAGSGGRTTFEKITACGHAVSFLGFFCFWAGPRNGNLAKKMRHADGRTCMSRVRQLTARGSAAAGVFLLLCGRLRWKWPRGLDRLIVLRSNSSPKIVRRTPMVRSIVLASVIATLAIGSAFAQESCESKAVGKDGKALAGAAKTSFMKKCMADQCATKAVSSDGKPLAGAAKTSFMTKCEKG